jgi:hypothetical protein
MLAGSRFAVVFSGKQLSKALRTSGTLQMKPAGRYLIRILSI